MDYILDFSKAEKRTISNDAYYFFAYDEPVIDEENLVEIRELFDLYDNGFMLAEDAKFIGNGLVDVTIIPYKEDDFVCDAYIELFNGWQLQIRWLDNKKRASIRYYHLEKPPFGEEEAPVIINKAGKPEIQTPSGSSYPIWKNVKESKH